MHFDAIRMPKEYFRAATSLILLSDDWPVSRSRVFRALIEIFIGEHPKTGMSGIAFGRLVNLTLIISGFALLVMA
jgi:hypothetical protein